MEQDCGDGASLEKPDLSEAGAAVRGEHEMIEHRAIEGFGGAGKAPGRSFVRLARCRVSAGVVVGEQDAGAAVTYRIGDDGA